MANILKFPEHSRIQEEASRWLIRLDGGAFSDEEAEAFSVWLSASQQHRDAIVELCRLWDNMEILSELSVLFPYDDKIPSKSKQSSVGFNKPALSFNLVAASLLVVITLLLVQQQFEPGRRESSFVQQDEITYQTVVGEQQKVLLEDGSIANLNTNSLIKVHFTDRQRNIRLVRGEVYFEVAHAPDRPFLVQAGGGIVRAVGTAFSVRLTGQDMEVTVTDGKVEVASVFRGKSDGSAVLTDIVPGKYTTTLGVGQTVEFSEKAVNVVKTIEPEDVSRKLSWQHGMLEFKGEVLEEVVREISRYTNKKIIISDDSIRDIRIGGYFKTGEIEALLTILKDGFQIDINRVDEDLIYLTERNPVQDTITN